MILNLVKKYRFFILSGVLFLIDQLTKLFIVKLFPNPIGSVTWITDKMEDKISILNPILKIQRLENPNLAFGLNPGDSFDLLINALTIILTLLIAYYLYVGSQKINYKFLKNASLSLILGGALGNLYDRLVHGAVVDFIDVGLTEQIRFPFIFNMADSFITIGMILIIFSDFFLYKKVENEISNS